jgi:general secretion pathway protein J
MVHMKPCGDKYWIPDQVRHDRGETVAKGFTLIEILIAIFILAIVLSTIYAAYTGTFRIIKASEYDSDIYTMARTTMERMVKDLGAISAHKGRFELISKPTLLGEKEFPSLSFTSTGHVEFSDKGIPSGTSTISYFVEEDNENKVYTLFRDDVLISKPDKQETPRGGFVLCERLQSLTYKFYDTAGKEYDTWDSSSDSEGQKNKAPSMVSIHLYLVNPDDQDRPYKFMTKVFLPINKSGP